jgi:hypothetical protein
MFFPGLASVAPQKPLLAPLGALPAMVLTDALQTELV